MKLIMGYPGDRERCSKNIAVHDRFGYRAMSAPSMGLHLCHTCHCSRNTWPQQVREYGVNSPECM